MIRSSRPVYNNCCIIRNSRPLVLCKNGVLTNFAKYLLRLFFNESCRHTEFNFIKKEIPAQIFSCEFCEISHNTFYKETFRQLLPHKHSFCLLSHHDLIYRLATRVNSIFQTLSQIPIFNQVEHLRRSPFFENS